MIAVFTEGKAPMQTEIDGFAYIYCCGAPRSAIEARIGDKMYGLCVLSDEGYGYISVPKSGTYDLYVNGALHKSASVSVTEKDRIYNSGLKYPKSVYDFNTMNNDEMSTFVDGVLSGMISLNNLSWDVGDTRTVTVNSYETYKDNVLVAAPINYVLEIVGKNPQGITYENGDPVNYIIQASFDDTHFKNYPEYKSKSYANVKDIYRLFKVMSYENAFIDFKLKYNDSGSITDTDITYDKEMVSKRVVGDKPLSFYNFTGSVLFGIVSQSYGYRVATSKSINLENIFSKLKTKGFLQPLPAKNKTGTVTSYGVNTVVHAKDRYDNSDHLIYGYELLGNFQFNFLTNEASNYNYDYENQNIYYYCI